MASAVSNVVIDPSRRSILFRNARNFPILARAAVCAAASLAGPYAMAQSSVTLYGTVDDSIQYTSNQGGHSNVQTVQGGLGSSKWGLNGAEDIGGGTSIIFKLESGFNLNNGVLGNNGALFGRRAYVGGTGSYGTLTLGRQYDLSFDTLCPYSAACKFDGGLGSQIGDLNNVYGDFNISNSVKYQSPSLKGFQLSLLYGFGNVAGSFSTNQTLNAAASYQNGPVSLAATYLRVSNPAVAVWGATAAPVQGQNFTNPLASPIFRGYASAQHLQISGAGANVSIGPGTLGLIYTNTLMQDVIQTNTTPNTGTAVFNDVQANYVFRVTPFLQTGVAFNYTWAPDARYEQVMLGASYFLSKRTSLYVTSAYQHAHGVSSLGTAAVATNSNVAASDSPNQLAIRVGIRSNF